MHMTNEAILIIDPDSAFALRLQVILEMGGYDVVTAASAEEARQLLEDTPVAILLIGLPPGDEETRSFVREIADHPSGAECILLAEPAELHGVVELYDLGNIYNHRWKPLQDVGDLARDIGRALERRSLKRQNAYLLAELRDAREELRRQAETISRLEEPALVSVITAEARGSRRPRGAETKEPAKQG
jgi:DNA-binding NtrC family response regulator